jgi:psiF repeat
MAATSKETTKSKKDTAKKELTPQQQKMKDCAAKWKDEKKAKNVSGRKAYNEFMSKCLKG